VRGSRKGAELGSENITVIANGLGSSARQGKAQGWTSNRRKALGVQSVEALNKQLRGVFWRDAGRTLVLSQGETHGCLGEGRRGAPA